MLKTLKDIKKHVDKKFDLDMSNRCLDDQHSFARCLYVMISSRLTNKNDTHIASIIKRDRCTVNSIRKRSYELFETNPDFRIWYYDILENFKHLIPFDQRMELSEYFKLKSEAFKP